MSKRAKKQKSKFPILAKNQTFGATYLLSQIWIQNESVFCFVFKILTNC